MATHDAEQPICSFVQYVSPAPLGISSDSLLDKLGCPSFSWDLLYSQYIKPRTVEQRTCQGAALTFNWPSLHEEEQ